MSTNLNRCPECGTKLNPELIRCSNCLAFVHDINPWQREHKLIALPISLILTTLIALCVNYDYIPGLSRILGDGISMTILGIGFYALIVIMLKNIVTSRQIQAFRLIRRMLAPGTTLTRNALSDARDAILSSGLAPFNTLLAYNRLQWVIDAAAVDVSERELLLRSMREHSETDWESLEGTFSYIQYLVWLLPSLGFLGTVWGMSTALGGFSEAVNTTAADLAFKDALTETAKSLGVAFHTTLVGLALVIPVLLAATAARRRVQHLLEQLDRFFIRYCSQPMEFIEPTPEDLPIEAIPSPFPDESSENADRFTPHEEADSLRDMDSHKEEPTPPESSRALEEPDELPEATLPQVSAAMQSDMGEPEHDNTTENDDDRPDSK